MRLASWNIRGVNHPSKQQVVRHFLLKHRVDVMGMVETRVKVHNDGIIEAKLFGHNWGLANNYQFHPNGIIWLAWNKARIRMEVLHSSAQMITGVVDSGFCSFWLSVVDGLNSRAERQELWHDLASLSSGCSVPWILMGDFNVVLHDDEKKSAGMFDHGSIRDFGDCCQSLQLMDLPYQGVFYSWSINQFADARTWCKLDRVMGNCAWFHASWDVQVDFLEPGISDHSPIVVASTLPAPPQHRQFRFLNCWAADSGFLPLVATAWPTNAIGCPMFRLITRLKQVKAGLKELHRTSYPNVSDRVA
ncbi:hypothetical protein RND81_09G062300 [Saponaria officinalis]|uniref:Endonuclease/exonuclease/phosphatase domain-containing protein n=1 Tax=Saponaria officinalis TaxID=3572 RepID=A0AAW1IJD5_SAPOF